MAKNQKLKTDLGDESNDTFYTLVMLIYNSLTGNSADFTGIPIEMGNLNTTPANTLGYTITIFNNIRLKIDYPSKVPDTEAARTAVQKMITQDGNWLNTFCDGNLSLLRKTGYPLAKEAEAQGVLPQTILDLTAKTAGVEFFISHLRGSGIHYGIMFTLASNVETNPAKWSFYYCAQREGTISGILEAVTAYKFVSFGMGTEREVVYSDVIVMTTL